MGLRVSVCVTAIIKGVLTLPRWTLMSRFFVGDCCDWPRGVLGFGGVWGLGSGVLCDPNTMIMRREMSQVGTQNTTTAAQSAKLLRYKNKTSHGILQKSPVTSYMNVGFRDCYPRYKEIYGDQTGVTKHKTLKHNLFLLASTVG